MTRIFRTSLFAILAAVPVAASPLAAQTPAAQPAAATCSVDFSQPKEYVTLYNIGRARAIQLPAGDERAKSIRDIMKSLANPKNISANPQGTSLFAGQMMILWMLQPGSPATATRGQLNWGEPKDAVIDLAKTADSLFTAVETAQPVCVSETKIWRQYKPWQDRINAAFKALQNNQLDSAEMLAKSSMVLDRMSPYAYRVLAAVAQGRGSQGDMLQHLEKALAMTVGDTGYAEDRRAVQFQIGQVGLEYAEIQPEPKRTETLRNAANAMIALATESPAADVTPYALSGLGMAAASLKDSSLFAKCFDIVNSATDKYNDLATLQAAMCANRNGKTVDAVRLFEVTVAKNPNARDALYNGAALLYELRKGDEMLTLVSKLVAIDPSNPDNVSLYAYAYNVIADKHKPVAPVAPAPVAAPVAPAGKPGAKGAVKPAPAPVAAPAPAPVPNPWIDSVSKYMKQSDDMPQKVTITDFVRYTDRAMLKGDVENRSKVARSYEVEFEFLDLAGAVIDKQVAKVGPVEPGKPASFTLNSAKAKIVAWRYAPIK